MKIQKLLQKHKSIAAIMMCDGYYESPEAALADLNNKKQNNMQIWLNKYIKIATTKSLKSSNKKLKLNFSSRDKS